MQKDLFNREEMAKAWEGFKPGQWSEDINVRDFIQENYHPYYGDESFLENPTENTTSLWDQANGLIQNEVKTKTIFFTREIDTFLGKPLKTPHHSE